MKHLLFAAALAAAVPASAQVASSDQTSDIAAASVSMRALAEKLAPAAVDPKPLRSLTDRLSKDGTQLQMEKGEIGNMLARQGYFSRLEATSDDWAMDPKTGAGRVDEWHYVFSLDGKLLSVEHAVVPIELIAPGVAAPIEAKGRSYRMSPSDASVQRRWRKFSKELLTLGKTVEV
jgi:hypothetical protein